LSCSDAQDARPRAIARGLAAGVVGLREGERFRARHAARRAIKGSSPERVLGVYGRGGSCVSEGWGGGGRRPCSTGQHTSRNGLCRVHAPDFSSCRGGSQISFFFAAVASECETAALFRRCWEGSGQGSGRGSEAQQAQSVARARDSERAGQLSGLAHALIDAGEPFGRPFVGRMERVPRLAYALTTPE
jgi:hypothetical protein